MKVFGAHRSSALEGCVCVRVFTNKLPGITKKINRKKSEIKNLTLKGRDE